MYIPPLAPKNPVVPSPNLLLCFLMGFVGGAWGAGLSTAATQGGGASWLTNLGLTAFKAVAGGLSGQFDSIETALSAVVGAGVSAYLTQGFFEGGIEGGFSRAWRLAGQMSKWTIPGFG